MTATATEVLNPYLRDFLAAGGRAPTPVWGDPDYGDYVYRDTQLWAVREKMVRTYAWAIPNEAAVAALVALGPIVEIGAGTGYWAGQIAMTGGDVLAYDIHPPSGKRTNPFGHRELFHPVIYGGAVVARRYPDRALLLCWPPYRSTMAVRALQAYRGDSLAYIGESRGGCTGNEDFHALLSRRWTIVTEMEIPRWPGMNDSLTIYHRA